MIEIKKREKYKLYVDNKPFFIKGVGGASNIELAAKLGANSIRTWSCENGEKILEKALQYNMKVMLTFELEKEDKCYFSENYKDKKKEEIRRFVKKFCKHKAVLLWNLGNEVNLGKTSKEAWKFIEELADMIKKIDKLHPVATIIAWADKKSLNSISKYCHSIDIVGINAYAKYFNKIIENYEQSLYSGPIIITEWGTIGHWESEKTEWEAPIEPTGMERVKLYEKSYEYIVKNSNVILGSYVFFWGQKQEITPTWYSMFAEWDGKGNLNGEPFAVVKLMECLWKNNKMPEILDISEIKINGKYGKENIKIVSNEEYDVEIVLTKKVKKLSLLVEVQEEEKEHGLAGENAIRPKTVEKNRINSKKFRMKGINKSGEYRLLVYVLNENGFVGNANVPFKVT